MISHIVLKMKTMALEELVQVLEPLESHVEEDIQRRMTPYNKDSFSASFESMSIETQFNDSLNKANIYVFYALGYG